jgi:multidrug resistance efflux pump
MRNRHFLGLLVVLTLLSGTPAAAASAPALPPAVPAEAASSNGVSFEGRRTPRQSIALALPAGARAARVLAAEGQAVETGDVLIQLDAYPQALAGVAQAELELVQARQALEALYKNAGVALAQAEVELAEAGKAQALAADLAASLARAKTTERIQQAYANLLLAEKRRDTARSDLAKARKRFANKKSLIWYFISRKQFALGITQMEGALAYYERRYQDAKDQYEDLLEPVDAIDLAVAQGNLAAANARLAQARRERAKRLNGPDPDELATAQARLKLAESNLAAARVSLRSTQIVSPISGVLVSLNVKQGEWIAAGQPAAIVASLDQWVVESKDLKETSVPAIRPGQAARVTVKAYPEVELSGRVESVSQYDTEEDGDIFYQVKVALDEPAEYLRWGMSAEVVLEAP